MKPRMDAVVCLVAAWIVALALPRSAHLAAVALPASDHRDARAMGATRRLEEVTDDGAYDDGAATDDGAYDDGGTDGGVTDDGVTDDGAYDDGYTDDGGGNPTSPTASPSAGGSSELLDDVLPDTSRVTCRAQGRKCSGANPCCDGLKCVRNQRGKKKCKPARSSSGNTLGSGNGNGNGNTKKCKRKGKPCGGSKKKCCDGLKCRRVKNGMRKCK